MTGLHPIHTGMQSGVLVGAAPYALPLKHKLLPEFLNDLGYQSVAVGKWHLGSHSANYTPTRHVQLVIHSFVQVALLCFI